MIKAKVRKTINIVIAAVAGYIPILIEKPQAVYFTIIMGMCAIVCISYYILDNAWRIILNEDNDKFKQRKEKQSQKS